MINHTIGFVAAFCNAIFAVNGPDPDHNGSDSDFGKLVGINEPGTSPWKTSDHTPVHTWAKCELSLGGVSGTLTASSFLFPDVVASGEYRVTATIFYEAKPHDVAEGPVALVQNLVWKPHNEQGGVRSLTGGIMYHTPDDEPMGQIVSEIGVVNGAQLGADQRVSFNLGPSRDTDSTIVVRVQVSIERMR